MEKPTFSEYVIKCRSEEFYFVSVRHMLECRKTLEEWFRDMYFDYKLLYLSDEPNNSK